VLAPGQSTTCTATYSVTQADLNSGVIRNSATVVASGVLSNARVSSSADVTVSVSPAPAISISKRSSAATVAIGTTITYTFVVTNTGNVPLTAVTVRDPLPNLGAISCGAFDGSLDPGESVTCTAPYRVSSGAATNGRITNVATATGTAPSGAVVSATGTAVVSGTGGGIIPVTGSDVGLVLAAALLLVFVGLVLLAAARRRRPPRPPSYDLQRDVSPPAPPRRVGVGTHRVQQRRRRHRFVSSGPHPRHIVLLLVVFVVGRLVRGRQRVAI